MQLFKTAHSQWGNRHTYLPQSVKIIIPVLKLPKLPAVPLPHSFEPPALDPFPPPPQKKEIGTIKVTDKRWGERKGGGRVKKFK